MKNKAQLFHRSKLILDSGLVREVVIWIISGSSLYPEGVRYRLVLTDPFAKKVLLLFDNHFPKGHHYHDSRGKEFPIDYYSMEKLIEKFLRMASVEEKNYENTKNKNSR